MKFSATQNRAGFLLVCAISMIFGTSCQHTPASDESGYLPRAESIQASNMAFADRFISRVGQAITEFEPTEYSLDPVVASTISNSSVASMAAAVLAAANVAPDRGLLDLAILSTLERLVYEDYWQAEAGESVDVFIIAYRANEADVWSMLSTILSLEEEREFMSQIEAWHRDHPRLRRVGLMRPDAHSVVGEMSQLRSKIDSDGLLAPVSEATAELEEAVLLGERTLFMLGRMSLLTGPAIDAWTDQWLARPQIASFSMTLTNSQS